MGGWVVTRGSEILHVYTSCIHTFMLFQRLSRNSSFDRDLFLACTTNDSEGIVPKTLR